MQKSDLLIQEELVVLEDKITKWDEIYLHLMQGHACKYYQVKIYHLEMIS